MRRTINEVLNEVQVGQYGQQTDQGWIILDTIIDNNNDRHVVVFRPNAHKNLGQYAWGSYYSPIHGNWGQGNYDYETHQDALNSLIRFLKGGGRI